MTNLEKNSNNFSSLETDEALLSKDSGKIQYNLEYKSDCADEITEENESNLSKEAPSDEIPENYGINFADDVPKVNEKMFVTAWIAKVGGVAIDTIKGQFFVHEDNKTSWTPKTKLQIQRLLFEKWVELTVKYPYSEWKPGKFMKLLALLAEDKTGVIVASVSDERKLVSEWVEEDFLKNRFKSDSSKMFVPNFTLRTWFDQFHDAKKSSVPLMKNETFFFLFRENLTSSDVTYTSMSKNGKVNYDLNSANPPTSNNRGYEFEWRTK